MKQNLFSNPFPSDRSSATEFSGRSAPRFAAQMMWFPAIGIIVSALTSLSVATAALQDVGSGTAAASPPATTPETADAESDVKDHTTFRPIVPADAPANGFAQEKPRPLKVKIYPLYDSLPRGGKCIVAVELQIGFGWHVNANPAKPDFLVPTELKLITEQKIKLKNVKYPEAHELKVDGSDEPYHVYDGKVLLYGLLEVDPAETADVAEMEFRVAFQGCNAKECLPPDLIAMKGKLPFAAEGKEPAKINPEKWPKPEKEQKDPADPAASKS
ncbi:MAG: hypothetical protein KDA89_18395 [Planctomycetaceae bacterium]|nr:hypothetical protein [Planctomycetaceae bacterium]